MVIPLVVLCTACYGDTTPATHVASTTATLNGFGYSDPGGDEIRFEYRVVAGPTQTTPIVTVDGAAYGPFRQVVKDLTPATNYEYRICGRNIGAVPWTCGGTWETFTTL
jgi:hypothetical protein